MTDAESTDPSPIPLWTDDALDSQLEDRLDRKRFADMVADRINACTPGQKSTVFGLVGPWGSGKTSLIKFILDNLTDNWKIANFSPWASDNATGLQLEFLSALASLLEGNDEKARNAKDSLKKYAAAFSPLLGAIPVVGSGVSGAAKSLLDLTNTPWHKQFEDVSKTLESLGSRVLLVADDIDRLDADELLALLKVVRLLGRFPNVHYLIAYDHATVEKLLETRALGRRSSVFMEKIVQYPFEVPPIAPVIQRRLLSEAIVKFITLHNIRLKDSQAERFSEFIGVLAPAFVTPRAQNRFGEQLLSFGGMLDFEEIDVVDFVALSFLRVFYHGIYDRIQAWKSALQSGKELVGYTSSDISDGEWIRRIRDAVDLDDDVIVVKRVLAGLFPGIRSDMLYARAHPRSLSDDDYFHRYFLFGIPENDIQDQLIKSAITNIVVDNATDPGVLRYSEILDGENDQLAALGYEKGQKLRADVWVGASLSLVVFLFDRIKALPEEVPSFDSGERVLWRWVATETLESLISGELTAESIFASGLSEYHVLMLVGRMMAAESRHSDDRMARALEGFSGIYRDRLMNDLDSVLDSNLDFNSIVSVISRLSTDKNFHELGDTLISSGEPDQLDRVAQAMVTVNRWRGSDGTSDELVFNSDTLERVFKPEAVIELAGRLPVAPPVLSIEKLDTSSENRAFLARAAVKSIAGTPS